MTTEIRTEETVERNVAIHIAPIKIPENDELDRILAEEALATEDVARLVNIIVSLAEVAHGVDPALREKAREAASRLGNEVKRTQICCALLVQEYATSIGVFNGELDAVQGIEDPAAEPAPAPGLEASFNEMMTREQDALSG